MYKLYSLCQSGNSFKVAFLLRALNQPFENAFVDMFQGVTRSNEWREQANEMGEVPILEDGERRLTQSGVILSYLSNKHGAFGGKNEDEKLEVLRWLLFDNHKFTSYFASYRFNKSFGPAAPDPAVQAWLLGRIDNAFTIVNKHLAGREYLVGDAPTIADFSLSSYLFYPEEESGYKLTDRYPHIVAWLDRLRALPGWAHPYEVLPGERITPKW
ncbi:glutathione S-transferase [Undibacterium sp. KW1]|uniref:glutathione S-transferase family protein n=1 Tax=Undibacterium sp. KW1 TaxID=2058624 RepID=UPI001331CC0D|nr:glutathione S-transferase family protein [Undibacterium sp. KW1]BBB61883.1 glutathione S-transferase [Undibacterium sp. KW1]